MDSIASENESQEGGAQWELETAWRQATEARRVGDTEAETLAMRRYAEGLVNASLGVVGQVLSPLDGHIREMTRILKEYMAGSKRDLVEQHARQLADHEERLRALEGRSDVRD